jgi:diguanylate cyclase (GGDEF)-like protein
LQIRSLFLVCMTALAVMAASLGGWMVAQAAADFRLASRVQRAMDVNTLLFAAADRFADERTLVGTSLLADDPADATLRAALERRYQASDQALIQAEQLIASLSYPGVSKQLEIIGTVRHDLATWRMTAAEMIGRPRTQREPDLYARSVAVLNGLFDALDSAMDLGDVAASRRDGVMMDLMALSRQSWSVRRMIRSRTVPLVLAIDAGLPLGSAQLEQQARFNGKTGADWARIDARWLRLADVPGLGAKVAAAHTAFNEHDRLCDTVIAAGRAGNHYPITAADLAIRSAEIGRVLQEIRDTALAAARDWAADSRQAAALRVVSLAAVVVLFLAVTLAVLTLLKRRIVSPLLALTEAIGRLARREYDVAIQPRMRTDEVGRVAVALEALRRGAMAAEKSEAQIVHMACHDALTGLPNRNLLYERMEHALGLAGRGQNCAALCLDLDRFKDVNDTFGHPVGDQLLQAVSERLLACVRENDTVSRLGGDEFVVLLIGLETPESAGLLAQRIVRTLSEPFDLDGHSIVVGASVGIAVTPQDATSAVTLLKSADTALYRAKLDEPGSYRFFEPDMDARLQARVALERDLRQAVRDEAFALAYQPQYNLATDQLCGFEALLRWHHPVRGTVGPAEFIPLAEDTGLIVPIGAWVLREACAEAVNWPATVKLAVNLSAVQFKSQVLVQTVRQALADSGLAPTRLELEITEGMLLNNNATTLAVLHELHDLGVSISMDDFGTGYSSLSYLRSFPFDKIKIDQSFVRDLSQREDSRAIIRAVVALGKSLGMTTTAEGVETEDQLAQLRREGCTEVQGYLFSKPTSAEAARRLAHGVEGTTFRGVPGTSVAAGANLVG